MMQVTSLDCFTLTTNSYQYNSPKYKTYY